MDAMGNTNRETIERNQYIPPMCEVFSSPSTRLIDADQYRFEIDREAEKKLPDIIRNPVQTIAPADVGDTDIQEKFGRARKIGIVFSGGPAPGGHNVIAGLFDAAVRANPENEVHGFLMGPDGIIENESVRITEDLVKRYRNLGGFTMIRTGRTKIDTEEKMQLSRETCRQLALDALVVVGGDDSNTNAAFLAQEMVGDGVQVIGVPKTIDGDIQVRDASGQVLCAMSFGFHTAARAFSQNISNLCTDSSSDV
jgi:pyrophosphate--fructose-6-phosphate 1-phosphotransferase